MSEPIKEQEIIVCDLDGTLIATDLLAESFLKLIFQRWYLLPFYLLALPLIFLTQGRAGIKIFFASQVQIDATILPYRNDVLQFLRDEKSKGAYLVLASAAAQSFVTGINQHLKIFDAVYGTTKNLNLKGKNKRDFLKEKFGDHHFSYVGDSRADIPVWKAAKRKFVVSSPSRIARFSILFPDMVTIVSRPEAKWWSLVKALRIHQWTKNILIFIPFLTAHLWDDSSVILDVVTGFISFSIVASAVYVLNDLADLESDRQHRSKKTRPFASGNLPILIGVLMVPLLLFVGFGLASVLGGDFVLILAGYFLLTTLYSFWLKRIALIDIITLSSLYTVRIFAGAVIVSVPISQWLAAFSMFLFFSLAALKRFVEVADARVQDRREIKGRGYTPNDLEIISHFGVTSGLIAVLVLALYVNSEEVTALYTSTVWLWGFCPLFFYWITRLWLKASRQKMNDDPIVFALKDPASVATGLLVILFGILAL